MYSAVPPAQDVGDAVGPAAEAALVPGAAPATADQDLVPTPGPSPILPRGRRQSPHLGPAPGPSLGPGAALLHPTKLRGQDLKARPSHQGKMEGSHPRASITG